MSNQCFISISSKVIENQRFSALFQWHTDGTLVGNMFKYFCILIVEFEHRQKLVEHKT